jgi:hypothetical protein
MYEVRLYEKVVLARTRSRIIALIEYWGWKTTYWNNIELRKTDE